MTLRCLFVDFNSYFASVEQYDEPRLRQRPLGVVPVMAATTCCIAASREAKDCGVTTGTPVWEALQRCPDIMLVQARPSRYIELHHQLMAAIGDCIPIHGPPPSIDEVACLLIGRERQRANAEAIARRIKQTLLDRGFSPAIRCSIGIAPNNFLAKTASDMHKVDGLTVLEHDDLPHALHRLELRDLCGIGPSMEQRLLDAGIHTVAQLCAAPRPYLRAVWGGVEGERFWAQLRGIEPPSRTRKSVASVGHSHVLDPKLRTPDGMRSVLFKLLAKAAMRMRREHCLARGMAIRIRFIGLKARFSRDLVFAPLNDTPTLLHLLGQGLAPLQRSAKNAHWNPLCHPPLSVAVTLIDLQPCVGETPSLFAEHNRAQALTQVLDAVNSRYGNNRLYFAAMQDALSQQAAPMRIPFSHIPDQSAEVDIGDDPDAAEAGMDELWLQRLRQFNVLAEQAHRKTRGVLRTRSGDRPAKTPRLMPAPYGAGAWARAPHDHDAEPPQSGVTPSLF